MNQVIIVPTETKRDCVIGQDGKRYCEDSGEGMTAREGGLFLLAAIGFCLWVALPILMDWEWVIGLWLWFLGIPLLLALVLVLW